MKRFIRPDLRLWTVVLGIAWMLTGQAALAQPEPRMKRPERDAQQLSAQQKEGEPKPEALQGADVENRLDEQVPKDLVFRNADGEKVRLGKFFDQGKPVIFNPAYYTCPMLCGLVRQHLVGAMQQEQLSDWRPGKEYEVVTFSIDPDDGPERAAEKKEKTLKQLGMGEDAADGWHFLTGSKKNIAKLSEAIGWGYNKREEKDEYAHSATLVLATPDGRVGRYLEALEYDARTLRLSLVELSEGAIGSFVDDVVLYCCRFDPDKGYVTVAMNVMRLGGALTVLALGGVIGGFLAWEFRKRARAA